MSQGEGVEVRVLGAVAAERSGERLKLSAGAVEALAALVAAGPDGLTSDQAAERFWGENQPGSAGASVRMRMTRLRRTLGEDVIPPNEATYRLAIPAARVDAWQLRTAAGEGTLPVSATELLELVSGDPYSGHEHVAGHTELRRVEADRAALLRRAAAEGPSLLDDRVVSAAFDLGVCLDARAVLPPPAATGPPTAATVDAPALATQLRASIVGRDTEVEQLSADLERTPTALVLGPGGAGKTRLLAELASRRDLGVGLVYAAGRRATEAAYGPFLGALPGFAERLADLDLASHDDELVRRSRIWTAFVASLRDRLGEGTGLVVVDDAQWLDSGTAVLVQHLASAAPSLGVHLVVAGRSDDDGSIWSGLRTALVATAPTTALDPLDTDDLERLIGDIHPSSQTQARRRFAVELARLSRGLPAIARLVIANADPLTLRHRPLADTETALDVHLDDLPDPALDIASTAAVLGDPMTITDLVELTGHAETMVVEMLDLLHRRRLIREDEPESIVFEHVLIRDAFEARTLPARRRRLHRAAAGRATTIAERAGHLLRAVPIVDTEVAFEALVAAGRDQAARGLAREAFDAFADADDLVPGRLATADLVEWAIVADRAGLDAHDLRVRAFEQATAEGDASSTLAAAMAGLPEAEPQGGDLRRLSLLASIDPDRLGHDEQFSLTAELGRQYELVGRTISSRKMLGEAIDLARTPEQHASLVSLRRLVDYELTSPLERLAAIDLPDPTLSAHSAARIHLLRCFDHLAAGDLASAIGAADAAGGLLEADDSPLLRWWLLVTRSTLAWTAGAITEARAAADAALHHGRRFGLRNATAAWVGQQWTMARAFGPVPELAAAADALPPDVSSSPVARVGVTILRLDAATSAAARRALAPDVRRQAVEALELPGHTGLVMLAYLARHLDPDDHDLIDAARSVLSAQRNAWIVFGTGVFVQGPADLALADLHTGSDRHDLLLEALTTADRFDSPPWQAIVRLEAARRGLGQSYLREAVELAKGTEFEASIAL